VNTSFTMISIPVHPGVPHQLTATKPAMSVKIVFAPMAASKLFAETVATVAGPTTLTSTWL
jgi:hypothetical protein